MALERQLQGFSLADRRLVRPTVLTVSEEKSSASAYAAGYEVDETIDPIVCSKRISIASWEYVIQSFVLEVDQFEAAGEFDVATSPATAAAITASLSFGAFLNTLDSLGVDRPWAFAPLCDITLTTLPGATVANPVRPTIVFHHVTTPVAVIADPTSGYDIVDASAFTAEYPGLLSQLTFGWYWIFSNSSNATTTLSLDVDVTKIWLNVLSSSA